MGRVSRNPELCNNSSSPPRSSRPSSSHLTPRRRPSLPLRSTTSPTPCVATPCRFCFPEERLYRRPSIPSRCKKIPSPLCEPRGRDASSSRRRLPFHSSRTRRSRRPPPLPRQRSLHAGGPARPLHPSPPRPPAPPPCNGCSCTQTPSPRHVSGPVRGDSRS